MLMPKRFATPFRVPLCQTTQRAGGSTHRGAHMATHRGGAFAVAVANKCDRTDPWTLLCRNAPARGHGRPFLSLLLRWFSWQFAVVLLLLIGLSPAMADQLQNDIAAVQAVGPQGAGHREAVDALRRLSRVSADSLPQLLEAMDTASPLADNWLRGAIETAADRALRNGDRLPVEKLEAFVIDTRHDPGARHLAFELVRRVDPSVESRLIPRMLNDPGVEFRRAAVARLIAEGQRLLDAEKASAARDVFLKALSGAVHKDQVDLLATRLEKLGQPVDIARHLGFIVRWHLCGPFDNTGKRGYDVAYPPEQGIDLAASYEGKSGPVRWIEHTTTDAYGMVDLNKALGKDLGVVGYATTVFVASEPATVEFRLGTPNAYKLWLNGKLIGQREVYHAGQAIDQYVDQGRLRRGENRIVLKICQNEQTESWAQMWEFQLRVCDAAGTAVLSADRPAPGSRTSHRTPVESPQTNARRR